MTARHWVALLTLTLGGSATAQDAKPDVTMPRTLTDKRMQPPGTFPEFPMRNDKKIDLIYFAASKGYPLRSAPEKESKPSGYVCAYLEMFLCLEDGFQTDTTYMLLAKQDQKGNYAPLGWIERSLVCTNTCTVDDETRIQKKAFLVNKPEAIRRGGELATVPIQLVPGAVPTPPLAKSMQLSVVLFIFQDHHDAATKTRWYLVGHEPVFLMDTVIKLIDSQGVDAARKFTAEVVLGWVPEDRVFLWMTREAIEFNRDNTLPAAAPRRGAEARVFEASADARAFARGKAGVEPLFQESFDKQGVSPAPANSRMRYPLARRTRSPRGDSDGGGDDPDGGLVLRVGFQGPVIGPDGKVSIEADAMAKLQVTMNGLKSQLANTEILFIIDATQSMEEGMRQAAVMVEFILQDVAKGGAQGVRFGIAFYKDYDAVIKKKEDIVKVFPMVDAGKPEAAAYLATLKALGVEGKLTGGGDPLEQVFLGLTAGIDETQFTPLSRKIVVTIGDRGDHAKDEDGKLAQAVVDRLFVPEDLSDPQRQKSLAPIEFYALQVVDPDKDADTRQYRDQLARVCRLYNAQRAGRCVEEVGEAKLYTLAQQKLFLDDLKARYAALKRRAGELEEQMRQVQLGRYDGIKAGGMMARLLEKERIPLDKLRGGVQVFSEGFVCSRHDKLPQVRTKYLMTDREVTELVGGVGTILSVQKAESDTPAGAAALNKLLVGLITGDAGSPDPDSEPMPTLAGRLVKLKGITFQSPLLQRTVEQLKNDDGGGGAASLQEFYDMKRRHKNLASALVNKRVVWPAEPEVKMVGPFALKIWNATETLEHDRTFSMPSASSGTIKWLWVDVETEMP